MSSVHQAPLERDGGKQVVSQRVRGGGGIGKWRGRQGDGNARDHVPQLDLRVRLSWIGGDRHMLDGCQRNGSRNLLGRVGRGRGGGSILNVVDGMMSPNQSYREYKSASFHVTSCTIREEE